MMDSNGGTVVFAGMDRKEAAGLYGSGEKNLPGGSVAPIRSILEKLRGDGYRSFSCVISAGFNLLAADAVAWMKEHSDPTIRLKAVVPYAGYGEDLDPFWDLCYRNVLLWADYTKVISDYPVGRCVRASVDYVLDDCALLLCWWDGRGGDTAYAVRRAREGGIPVKNLFQFTI